MSSHVTRLIMAVVSLVAVTFSANHCIMGDVFAAPSSHQQDSSTFRDHPCHGGEDEKNDTSSKSNSHHSKCQDQGCCSPSIQTTLKLEEPLRFLIESTPNVFNLNINLEPSIGYGAPISLATGPPRGSFQALTALSIAPNAPPVLT